jgi:hypothetical protein
MCCWDVWQTERNGSMWLMGTWSMMKKRSLAGRRRFGVPASVGGDILAVVIWKGWFPWKMRKRHEFANWRETWDDPVSKDDCAQGIIWLILVRTEVLQPHLKLALLRGGFRVLLRLLAMDLNSAAPVRRCHSPNSSLLSLPQPDVFR